MSVLIKGIRMPTSCEECRTVLGCCDELEDGTVWCRLAHGYIGDDRTVCPLGPVPPHGRCIDADALENRVVPASRFFETPNANVVVLGAIRSAPTIIPASEEGE